jgi:hypothetical protein
MSRIFIPWLNGCRPILPSESSAVIVQVPTPRAPGKVRHMRFKLQTGSISSAI